MELYSPHSTNLVLWLSRRKIRSSRSTLTAGIADRFLTDACSSSLPLILPELVLSSSWSRSSHSTNPPHDTRVSHCWHLQAAFFHIELSQKLHRKSEKTNRKHVTNLQTNRNHDEYCHVHKKHGGFVSRYYIYIHILQPWTWPRHESEDRQKAGWKSIGWWQIYDAPRWDLPVLVICSSFETWLGGQVVVIKVNHWKSMGLHQSQWSTKSMIFTGYYSTPLIWRVLVPQESVLLCEYHILHTVIWYFGLKCWFIEVFQENDSVQSKNAILYTQWRHIGLKNIFIT